MIFAKPTSEALQGDDHHHQLSLLYMSKEILT